MTRFLALLTLLSLPTAAPGPLLGPTRAADPAGVIESIIAPATEATPRNSEGDVIRLRDGSLLAAWTEFYGGARDDSAARITAARSTDGGRTWRNKRTLVENSGGLNVMSASFLELPSGELLLFYLEKHSRSDLDVLVRRSADQGRRWSEPVRVTDDDGYWVMNNARPRQLSSGRIVCPTAMTEQVWTEGATFRTVCFYSDDSGRTWRRGAGAVTAPKRGAMEPGVIERRDGKLLQYIRTQTGRQWFALSDDGGDTWTRGRPWTLVSPEAPATVGRLPESGHWLAVHNPHIDRSHSHLGKRAPLVARVSADHGQSWSAPKAIEEDPDNTYAYTSIDADSERVWLTYYVGDAEGRYAWKFKSLPLSWLPKPPPAEPRRLDRDDLLLFRDHSGQVRRATSVQQWQRRRQEVIRGMESVMGPYPGDAKRVDLDVQTLEETDLGSYVRRLVRYQSEPGCLTTAYLCIPKAALSGQRRAPAALCLHPTDAVNGHKVVVGLGGKENRQYAAELAERGYVTLSPSYPHLAEYYPNLSKLGYVSGTMKAIWDNSRGLDLLESMPWVDASQGFAAIGHSLGGHNAIYTAVFDPRITSVVSSCGFDAYPDYYDGAERVWYFGRGWCQIRYMPRMSNYRGDLEAIPFDFTELLGGLAPRRLLVNAPRGDHNFRWQSVDRCLQAARPIYRLYGAEKAVQVLHPDGGHDFPDAVRQQAYAFLDRHHQPGAEQ